MKQVVECVANFSEGRRLDVVDQIVGVERDTNDRPKVDVVMQKVRVVEK